MAEETPTPGKQVAQTLTLKTKGEGMESPEQFEIGYWVYLPKDYDPKGKPVPLVLFLHGAGERGNDLTLVKKHGLPMLIDQRKNYPFIVISPQRSMTEEEFAIPYKEWYKAQWRVPRLLALLDHVEEQYNVDKSRVYLTGLSMGGFGTWRLACAHPHRFAAIAPICGGGDPTQVAALKNMPVWTFHGDKDESVNINKTKEMVDALRAAGGHPKFTVYPGVGHFSWQQTYENAKLYEWLLEHTKQ